jgi:hypothetical protein
MHRLTPTVFRVARLLAVLLCAPMWAQAQPPPADTQVWLLGLATLTPGDWRIHLEAQPRFGEDVAGVDQVLSRWAVGRQVTSRVSIWGGHAWAASVRPSGNLHEQRLWQQLSAVLPDAGAWTPSLRLRLEQRFLGQWENSSHRFRALGRVVRPLDQQGTWSIAIWDEVFVTLDDTPGGPQQGYDRNRFFAGALRRLSPYATLEAGYLLQTVNYPVVGSRPQAHAAFAWLNLTF